MLRRFMFTAITVLACPFCFAQGVASVDLLNPEETTGTIPPNFRIVDVRVQVVFGDIWVAAGIRAATENGATINYFDADANAAGVQPGLFNGGTANKFYTMLSKVRGRDVNRRFTDAYAAAAGAYDPQDASPVTDADLLNVAYFASPPEGKEFPLRDGYIARISVDISGVTEIPGYPIDDYANWGAGPIVPPGALVVLRSVPQTQQFGTVIATFDVPELSGLNWYLYYVPEPHSVALLTIGALFVLTRR
jgi:hypothetical protein